MHGFCTGASLQTVERVLALELRNGEDKSLHFCKQGDELEFAIDKVRSCIGFRAPGAKSLSPCPLQTKGIKTSQCEHCFGEAKLLPCLRCTGDRCNNPARRAECVQPDNHIVYLASFGPGAVKVGVARQGRRYDRLHEQGARVAIIIAEDDGQQVRRIESQIKRQGIRDRVQPQEKLKLLTQSATEKELLEELYQTLNFIKPRTYAKWIDPEELRFDIPLLDFPPRFIAPTEGLHVHGVINSIVGQTIILDTDTNDRIAFEAGALSGFQLEEIQGQSQGQMAFGF